MKAQVKLSELCGIELDFRCRGCGFEPHRRYWIVSLSKTLYPQLSTGSTQEDRPNMTEKLLTGMYRNRSNKTKVYKVAIY